LSVDDCGRRQELLPLLAFLATRQVGRIGLRGDAWGVCLVIHHVGEDVIGLGHQHTRLDLGVHDDEGELLGRLLFLGSLGFVMLRFVVAYLLFLQTDRLLDAYPRIMMVGCEYARMWIRRSYKCLVNQVSFHLFLALWLRYTLRGQAGVKGLLLLQLLVLHLLCL